MGAHAALTDHVHEKSPCSALTRNCHELARTRLSRLDDRSTSPTSLVSSHAGQETCVREKVAG